jgi:hypothetical protein
MRKTFVKFLRLGSLIEFKRMVVLTNETQTMLSFSKIFKFNAVMYYPFIIILQQKEKKKRKKSHGYLWINIKKNIIIFFLCVKSKMK